MLDPAGSYDPYSVLWLTSQEAWIQLDPTTPTAHRGLLYSWIQLDPMTPTALRGLLYSWIQLDPTTPLQRFVAYKRHGSTCIL